MSEETEIQWCHSTFNPWLGCSKVSPGCANCYAEQNRAVKAFGVRWGKGQERRRTSETYWEDPIRWNLKAKRLGERHRVFCGSLCDWADEEVNDELRVQLFSNVIVPTPHLDWMLLTKRPENAVRFLKWFSCGNRIDNVWFGISAEDQRRWDERAGFFSEARELAAVNFVSAEPLLGEIIFGFAKVGRIVDLVIFGGESGPGARQCDVNWIRDGIAECRRAGISLFVKQVGSEPTSSMITRMDYQWISEMKDPKGGNPDEWCPDLRVREMIGKERCGEENQNAERRSGLNCPAA